MSSVIVQNLSFDGLKEMIITIPDFQRSYVWDNENLQKLIDDFEEFLLRDKNEYYMGTILLYKDGEKYEIIDGQQRITTLTILFNVLNNEFPTNFQLAFSSQDSINNIIKAKIYFDKNKEKINHIQDICNKLKFTVITTQSQDEAFTFFDTQNSRGVKLKAIDLLKAHHLRAINDNEKQRVSAKKWEKVENTKKGFIRENSDFIDELFKYILYRSRVWRGNQSDIVNIESSNRIQNEKIKSEFEKGHQADNIQLYPHHKNMFVHSIDIDENEEYILDFRWKQYRHKPKDLPFSLRQPISKGLEFFLFVEKYAQIVEFIGSDSNEISGYRDFYNKVISDSSFSIYLREFFILCVVCYYDKFEHQKLVEFSLWLEYILGAIRIRQSMIVERTVPKTIRELPYNMIDIIIGAYTPSEIIEFLKSIKRFENDDISKIYSFEEVKKNGEKEENTIRVRYKKSIIKYYSQDEQTKSLADKRIWIEKKAKNVK
jgi:hypothetical protein